MKDHLPKDVGGGLTKIATAVGVFTGFSDDVITNQLINFGAHTRNELAMVLDHVDESDVFVDIGAHIGTYAIPVARKLGLHGRVLAVEGSASTFALLRSNVIENGLADKIDARCAIVGDTPGRRIRRINIEGNTGASHYVFDEEADLAEQDAQELLCEAGFSQPNFIKIDVEGMEYFVLKSLESIISSVRPKLYIEMSLPAFSRLEVTYDDLQNFLLEHGYSFFRNFGKRNSTSDAYQKTQIHDLSDGGQFYDLLALPT